ncbi:MAG: pectin esterase [Bacteroidales bacterium]|nr:pectin esterase [Bacteroidales bacterium]
MKKTVLSLGTLLLATSLQAVTVFTIGDSTMANKPTGKDNQERGWGQMLSGFFTDDVVVDNHALNGRSSLSFYLEGEWQKVYDKIQPGDYVFIQFGHNDEKIKNAHRGTRPGSPEPAVCPTQWGKETINGIETASFDYMLKLYVDQTREKGGIPVLFNAIARRNFFENKQAAEEDDLFGKGTTQKQEGDTLVETHIIKREDGTVDDYLEAPRRVARENNVPFVEMNAISKQLVQSMGIAESKKLFCWIPADTNLAAPKGREDNTHLRIWGARQMCRATIDAIGEAVPALKPYIRKYDFIVAQDGSGDFFTVQEAINAIPDYNKDTLTILLQPGTYYEKLIVPESKEHIRLIAKTEGKCIITYDDYAAKPNAFGKNMGTSGSASVYIYAPDFEAVGITFQNTASAERWKQDGGGVGQAVAILVKGDRAVFRRCRFLGHQDTLYAFGQKYKSQSRQYYEDCYIEGTVDYIFGWATAVFNRCELHCLSNGYITAAATPEGQEFGYVFHNCKITSEDNVKYYLGRPWRPYSHVAYISCYADGNLRPEGWNNWGKTSNEQTAFYAEFNTKGDGGKTRKQRAAWSHSLNKKEAERYSIENVLKGDDDWNPGITFVGKPKK